MYYILFLSITIIANLLAMAVNGQGTNQQAVRSLLASETKWRGVFTMPSGLEVPFNFLIKKNAAGVNKVYLVNAEEKFEGGPITQKGDSLYVSLDQFENELAFKYDHNELTGILRRQDGKGTPLPVLAEVNKTNRFKENNIKPEGNISGTYAITFAQPGGKEEKAVGLFTQSGNKLKATFLKITGDSRYLDGVVEGNQFYLSSFIGSTPSYYKGTFTKDNNITGEIVGQRGSQHFSGVPDENAALPDAYSLTYIKDGYSEFNFSFPDLNGKNVSLKDGKYKDKVVILTIGGTWCPNCIDETAFLAPWYAKNKKRGVEIISLQYERQLDSAYVHTAIRKFRDRFNIQYDQLIAGIADKQKVAESLPALNTFLSFPTTIFIGRDGKVAKIHTGFTGPATGKYYEEFKKDFEEEVSALLDKKSTTAAKL